MKSIVFIFLIVFAYNAYSQAELDDIEIANITYQKSVKELDSIYNEILRIYATKPVFIEKVKKSQKAWKEYSVLALQMRYPDYNPLENQEEYNICFADEINEIIQNRISELYVWTSDVNLDFKFDDCRGSVKITDSELSPINNPVVFYYSKETKELDFDFNPRNDYVVFGYKKPDVTSEKLLLISVFTKDVEGNPNHCKYGSYYDTSYFEDFELQFDSFAGDFVKINLVNNQKVLDVVFVEKKFFQMVEIK